MKTFLTTTLILLSLVGFSQSKWSVDAYYSYDILSGDDFIGEATGVATAALYDEYNYSAGAVLNYHVSNNLSLHTGVAYSKQEIARLFVCDVCLFIRAEEPRVSIQRYLQVPIGASYSFLNGKFQPSLEGGFMNNILGAMEVDDALGNESPTSYFISGYVGAKMTYQFIDKLGVFAGVRYMDNLSSPFEPDVNWTVKSLNFGIRYNW